MIETSFIIGILLFFIYLLAVLLMLRISKKEPAILVILTAGFVYVAGLFYIVITSTLANFWECSIVYWFFVLCFLMAFGAIYKSLSLRILLGLLQSDEHSIVETELTNQYIKSESFQNRIEVMIERGYAFKEAENISLAPAGRKLASRMRCLQKIYNIQKSG